MVTKDKAIVPGEEQAIITWQGRNISITFDDVKQHICPSATDQEIIVFLRMTQSLNLNPWLKDIYMVKQKEDEPASYIVATQAYLKAAEHCDEFDGFESGVILSKAVGTLEFREGAFVLDSERDTLAGGWAKVYRKDRKRPFYTAVNLKECQKYTKEGTPTRFWRDMPATMVRKVALSRALREAFPTRLGGMMTEDEFESMPEGSLPPVLEKDGEPDWKKFYARIKSEMGITPEQAHELVGAASFKDLLGSGWTMEQIWDTVVNSLQHTSKSGEEIEEGKIVSPPETEGKPAKKQKVSRTQESVKTINTLLRACNEDFGLQPKNVYKELNVQSANDITESPWECYLRIAAVMQ